MQYRIVKIFNIAIAITVGILITIKRATKKRSKNLIPKMKQRNVTKWSKEMIPKMKQRTDTKNEAKVWYQKWWKEQ